MKKENIVLANFRHIDWVLISAVFILLCAGLIVVHSATMRFDNPWMYIIKQAFAVLIGALIFLIVLSIDYRFYGHYYRQLYYVSLFLLVMVLVFGKTLKGSRAWFDFGYFSFQPSEITKVLFILALGGYLDKNAREIHRLQKLVVPLLMLFGNTALILLQPDFSSTIVYFPVFIVLLYCAGARALHIAGILLFSGVMFCFPLLKTVLFNLDKTSVIMKVLDYHWQTAVFLLIVGAIIFLCWWFLRQWKIYVPLFYFVCTFLIIIGGVGGSYFVNKSIKDYQKKRLVVFINPRIDPLGAGYNIIQSQIAVGSGRFIGKGIFSGTQSQLGFVPAQHTDFIFSILSEEMGLVFSLGVILLYLLFIWRVAGVSFASSDRYGALVSFGILTMFSFHIIINVGMVIGLMPITGLPLPFISYGGSNVISSMVALAVLLSVYIKRFIY
ncbi:MAG: rod shape-determining protein RodA [Elusimicrobiota bacterium]